MKKHVVPLVSHRLLLPLSVRGAKGSVLSALEFFFFLACLLISAPTLPAQEFQPQPVSEYAEKSGPNTITFLSYPKYYTDSEGKLTPVITDLVTSKSPDWDFEVTTGIWNLRVKTDGTFQAEHAGNAFTYRLSQIGVGRGEAFQAFEWGEPNWKNYQIIGDKIRWYDVFRDVDIIVRYIHDILKVDVIVKSSLMSQIRAEVKKGSLNPDDYLTARFDIPNVWITTDAQLGGEKVDIYAERLDLQQPLEFVKDGKVVQRLRPVETHVLDAKGEPNVSFDEENTIRSAQTWRLKKDAPGVAEMSANLGDLAQAPEGDVAIDPEMKFESSLQDTSLNTTNSTSVYGGLSYLYLSQTFRSLLGFNIDYSSPNELLPAGSLVKKATLEFYIDANTMTSSAQIYAYKVTSNWNESYVTYRQATSSSYWTTYGGDFSNPFYQSRKCDIAASKIGLVTVDVTQPFKSHLTSSGRVGIYDKGFILKVANTPSGEITIRSSEYGTSAFRPKLVVEYGFTNYGMHISPNYDDAIVRGWMDRLNMSTSGDKFGIVRYLDELQPVPIGWLPTFCQQAYDKGLKVFIHSPVVGNMDFMDWTTPNQYAWHIYELLYGARDQIKRGDIIAIEIGGEESDWIYPNKISTSMLFPSGFTPPNDMWFGNSGSGANLASFYIAARDIIKNSTFPSWQGIQIWSGGSPEKHESLDYDSPTTAAWGNAGNFISGFIDSVISSDRDKLPDAIAIHGYTGIYPPEYTTSTSGAQEWPNRVKKLYDICNGKGYIPSFVVTEYGFSPTNNGFGPTSNASEVSQAVYFLRSCLINSTVRPYNGIGWDISSYFFHHMTNTTNNHGFHNIDNVDPTGLTSPQPLYYGSGRAIKGISRALFNPSSSPALKLRDQYTYTWVPLVITWIDDTYKGYAYCGWITGTGTKWGAIWRYDRESTYYNLPGASKIFKAPQNFGSIYVTNRYQFSISTGSSSLSLISDVDINGGTPENGYIPFTIPNVEGNPIILEFSN